MDILERMERRNVPFGWMELVDKGIVEIKKLRAENARLQQDLDLLTKTSDFDGYNAAMREKDDQIARIQKVILTAVKSLKATVDKP